MTSPDAASSPQVRPAIPADLPRLGRLGALLVEEHHAFDAQRFIAGRPRTPADYAAFLAEQLQNPDACILVADVHGDVVGYVYAENQGYDYLSLRGPAGVLHDIVVEVEARGRGIGRMLLDAALAEMRRRGAPRIVLSTAERNEVAQRMYARAGFRRTMVELTRELE